MNEKLIKEIVDEFMSRYGDRIHRTAIEAALEELAARLREQREK